MNANGEIPLGLGMALAQNEKAMERFGSLSGPERDALLEQAHQVRSRREMQALVERLSR